MLAALFAAGMIIASAAGAQATKGETIEGAEAKFAALDRNKDQRLSKVEASTEDELTGQFASLDTNFDGYLSKSEYVARKSRQPFPSNSDEY
jgi:phosphate-selective porin